MAEAAEKSKSKGRPGDRIVQADFYAGATQRAQFPPPTLAEIAFAGRSNVGKSSLLNSLVERRGLVRTSSTPGCTRQVSWFRIRADDGAQLDLADLPGYGYAKRSKSERNNWASLIEDYLLQRPTLRGVVMLVDVRREVDEGDFSLLELLRLPAETSRPALGVTVVATKLDKLSVSARKPALAAIEKALGCSVYGYSVPESYGRVPLWRRLRKVAGIDGLPSEDLTQGTAPR